jgi:hypothetical protein
LRFSASKQPLQQIQPAAPAEVHRDLMVSIPLPPLTGPRSYQKAYERRAEKAAHADAAKALARSATHGEREQNDRFARPLASVDDHYQAKEGRPPFDVS